MVVEQGAGKEWGSWKGSFLSETTDGQVCAVVGPTEPYAVVVPVAALLVEASTAAAAAAAEVIDTGNPQGPGDDTLDMVMGIITNTAMTTTTPISFERSAFLVPIPTVTAVAAVAAAIVVAVQTVGIWKREQGSEGQIAGL